MSPCEFVYVSAEDVNAVLTAEDVLHLFGGYSSVCEGYWAEVFITTMDSSYYGSLKSFDLALEEGIFDVLAVQ
jgi:hypothetical protein